MLVLSRKRGEIIYIGEGVDRVIVQFLDVKKDKVRLGFTAAPHVKIVRAELVDPPMKPVVAPV